MPKLVKGGKYVYGWVIIAADGEIPLPAEAAGEYDLDGPRDLIVIEGSGTSGGFGVSRKDILAQSPLNVILERYDELAGTPEGEPVLVEGRSKIYARVHLTEEGRMRFPREILAAFGVRPGDKILALRGSNIALSFAASGPIIDEASAHPELEVAE